MGYLKELNSNPDIQAFPGATFEIEGDVPASQCSEAKYEGTGDWTSPIPPSLTHNGAFVGLNFAGKKCTITVNPGGNTGTFDIFANDNDKLHFVQDPGNGTPPEYYIHNGGSLIITRDVAAWATYITAQGYSYTIKGGKLYTNMPSAQFADACTILFDPLT